jgi:pimeloyl-ACP methyl ester carboxylesterase
VFSVNPSEVQQKRGLSVNTHAITLPGSKQVDIVVDEYGSGQPFLVLHGGAGPQSVTGLAQRLATAAHVYAPTHPGFGGTNRPDWLNSVGALAEMYVAFIDQLDLQAVTVVGSSIGGWIAAEMAAQSSSRIRSFILIDAVGIVVEGQPIVDIFLLALDELAKLSYHNPAAFRIDPAALTDVQKRAIAANRQALAVYGGQPCVGDPTLLKRLGAVATPTLVLWGDSDGIVTPEYGRAFAAAIPAAQFRLLANTGHLPQLETPDQTLGAVWDFVNSVHQPTRG